MEDTNLKELELLGLTEKDFDMMIEGLEHLPSSGSMGEFMGDMLIQSMMRGHEEDVELKEAKQKIEDTRKEKEYKKKKLAEDSKILQSKLILFKRYMIKHKLFLMD